MSNFTGKKIVLGVTGCIAAYKSAELVRQIVKQGGQVQVIMTESAGKFITPLTLQTLSGNPVTTGLFDLYEEKQIGHISLAQKADVLVISPATANSLGKVAAGIADDILSTVIMATKASVLFAPAMNVQMWENPIVQKNIQTLKGFGYHFIEPGWGDLACGDTGKGRLADVEDIMDAITSILSPKDFIGKQVIVTAGPTQESLDPIRYITNPASGKMGFKISQAFVHRGAWVTLISGPTVLSPPRNVNLIKVRTAQEMASAVEKYFDTADIVIKSAAVADYQPRQVSEHKIKKTAPNLRIELKRTSDILANLGKKKGKRILVGFAAETQDLLTNARKKLQEKNLDMIIANDVSREDMGFGSDFNQATLMLSDGTVENLNPMSKDDLAHRILDRIALLQKEADKFDPDDR